MRPSPRKFSYASVREESGKSSKPHENGQDTNPAPDQDTPQSFVSSLSSEELEEVESIAWPCSDWCKAKGLCSASDKATHEEHVQARLDDYARTNPRKLEKIIDEIERRRRSRKSRNQSFGRSLSVDARPRTSSDLDIWRDKLKEVLAHHMVEELEDAVISDEDLPEHTHHQQSSELAPLEAMPTEILDMIFSYVTVDYSSDPFSRPFTDLCSLALVSKSLHTAAVRVMYRNVSIPQSRTFAKFNRSLAEDASLGEVVHRLDFSHYSNMGFGRTRSTSTRTPFLTPATIKECLDRVPNLRAFLVHEHVDDELDVNVIGKLLRMPLMQALDFTACSSKPFTDAFTTVCTLMAWRDNSMISLGEFSHPLKRLSLHECTTLQEPVFEALLPRLTNLTHLDVAHTLINDKALLSIPASAQITHLNLERCTRLTGSAVVRFLTSHPAARDTMVYLNLSADSSTYRLLLEEDVARLLAKLPTTLRSLNIGGAKVNPHHVPALQTIATHVEELGLKAAKLDLAKDVTRILGMPEGAPASTVRYLDLTDVKSVTQMSLSYASKITEQATEPLEAIEISASVLDEIKKRNRNVKNPAWDVRELGRRGWYVRQRTSTSTPDDGSRDWKMGARWWGMRKIPVVSQDVGGMYGYFMFKRN
jgi:hypothetical protein